MPKFKELEAKV